MASLGWCVPQKPLAVAFDTFSQPWLERRTWLGFFDGFLRFPSPTATSDKEIVGNGNYISALPTVSLIIAIKLAHLVK